MPMKRAFGPTPWGSYFIQALEESFPVDALYADMAGERHVSEEIVYEERESALLETAQFMIDALGGDPDARKRLKSRLHLLEPFCKYPEITARIKERIS